MRITVYYATADPEEIGRIRQEYGLPGGMSVNGESDCNLSDEQIAKIQPEVERGLIQLRKKAEYLFRTPVQTKKINRGQKPVIQRSVDKKTMKTPVRKCNKNESMLLPDMFNLNQ